MHTKLQKMRTLLVAQSRFMFYAQIALDMPIVEKLDLPVPTMGTDGTTIYYDPTFVENTPDADLFGVYIHEIMHVVMLTPWRRGHRTAMAQDAAGRKVSVWNLATDYINNDVLIREGITLPAGALRAAKYDSRTMTAEQVYEDLMQTLSPPPEGSDADRGFDGEGTDDGMDPAGGEGERVEQQARAQRRVLQAAEVAKAHGQLPAHLDQLVSSLLAPQRNWRDELIRYFKSLVQRDESWSRLNRRLIGRGLRFPTMSTPALGRVYVGVDTSGSVWSYIDDMAQTLNDIYVTSEPEATTVAYCDAQLQHVDEFVRGDELTFQIHGGGGTDLRHLFDHASQMEPAPDLMVVITDMESPWPDVAPDFPVLFVATVNHPAPFGDIIYI